MNNLMSYNNYTAKLEFDSANRIFLGRILGIADTIRFRGETVDELAAEFKTAVDNYLESCKDTGRPPQKTASGKLMLRISPDVHAAATIAAQAAGKSLNQWAGEALAKAAGV